MKTEYAPFVFAGNLNDDELIEWISQVLLLLKSKQAHCRERAEHLERLVATSNEINSTDTYISSAVVHSLEDSSQFPVDFRAQYIHPEKKDHQGNLGLSEGVYPASVHLEEAKDNLQVKADELLKAAICTS